MVLPQTKSDLRNCGGRNASTYPLGSLHHTLTLGGNTRERRRSAGDEHSLGHQMNMFVRTRTDSGKQLSDAVSMIYIYLRFNSKITSITLYTRYILT